MYRMAEVYHPGLVIVSLKVNSSNHRELLILHFQANIHSIMGSEDQVLELMLLLDTGLQQAMKIEEKLDEYEQKLQVNSRCQFGIGQEVTYELSANGASCVFSLVRM